RALDEDVLGLDVAMDDALGVALGEPEADLVDDRHRLLGRERAIEAVPLVERRALEEVHQHVDVAVGTQATVEGLDHVRVGQRAQDRDLAQRSLSLVAGGDRLLGQLERERLRVARDVDLVDAGERALAEDREDPNVAGVDVARLQLERHRGTGALLASRQRPDGNTSRMASPREPDSGKDRPIPLAELPHERLANITVVATDVDGTLTRDGELGAEL